MFLPPGAELVDQRFDFLASFAEIVQLFLFESGYFEGAVTVAVDLIAQLHRSAGQLVLIDGAEQVLVFVDGIITQRIPLASRCLGHVQHQTVGVQLRV